MLAFCYLIANRALTQSARESPAGDSALVLLSHTPPWQRMSVDRGMTPWRRLARESQRPAVGADIAGHPPLTVDQRFGATVSSAPNLHGALYAFCRYFRYVCDVDHLRIEEDGDETVIVWRDDADIAPHTFRDFVFSELCQLVRRHGYVPVQPCSVELRVVNGVADYREKLGCPVQSTRMDSCIRLPTQDLVTPMLSSNPNLHTSARARLAPFDVSPVDITTRAKNAVELAMDTGDLRIEAVAQLLGMRPRTLQKGLAEMGASYSELVAEVRRYRAADLLLQTDLSVSAIAHHLGYQNPAGFYRSFITWFGCSPREFRRQGGCALPTPLN